MKYLLLIIPIALFNMGAFAQSSLEFNQVITLSSTSDVAVPSSKVWKVVSYFQANVSTTYYANGSTCDPNRHRPFFIDGNEYWDIKAHQAGGGNSILAGNKLPIWLDAGTTVRVLCPQDIISIIEFNVTP